MYQTSWNVQQSPENTASMPVANADQIDQRHHTTFEVKFNHIFSSIINIHSAIPLVNDGHYFIHSFNRV